MNPQRRERRWGQFPNNKLTCGKLDFACLVIRAIPSFHWSVPSIATFEFPRLNIAPKTFKGVDNYFYKNIGWILCSNRE